MSIVYENNRAIFRDQVGSEEAAGLLQWLARRPEAAIDLLDCVEVHHANLQALLIMRTQIAEWPENVALAATLKSVLMGEEK